MTDRQHPLLFRPLLCLLLLAGLCLPAPAQELTELDGTPLATSTRRAWSGNYREFARFVAVFEDKFIVVPNYDRRTDNSHALSYRQAEEKLKITWQEDSGLIVRERSWTPPQEEIEAYSKLLPGLEIGLFGYVHSVEVVEVLGPEEMTVRNLWILDAQALERQYERDQAQGRASGDRNYTKLLEAAYGRRLALAELQGERAFAGPFRLVGYSTRGLRPGVRYTGPRQEGFQVAFVYWDVPPAEEDGPRLRDEDVTPVLVDPTPVMRSTVTEQQFVELLGQKQMTIAGFVELVRATRAEDRDTADAVVLTELLPPDPREPAE